MAQVGPGDFIDLVRYCADIIDRLRKLTGTYQSLNTDVGAMSMLFHQLRTVLQQFQGFPPIFRSVLDNIRGDCERTLDNVSNAIKKFEELSNANRVERAMKKLVLAVRNQEPELRSELQHHRNMVSQLLFHLTQLVPQLPLSVGLSSTG